MHCTGEKLEEYVFDFTVNRKAPIPPTTTDEQSHSHHRTATDEALRLLSDVYRTSQGLLPGLKGDERNLRLATDVTGAFKKYEADMRTLLPALSMSNFIQITMFTSFPSAEHRPRLHQLPTSENL